MQQFQNLYNAELRNGKDYCCCDISYVDVPCVADLTDLDVTACTFECEPFFDIDFKVCFANGTCSYTSNEIACINNIPATWTSPALVLLHSNESIIANITNVSSKKASLNCTNVQYKCKGMKV